MVYQYKIDYFLMKHATKFTGKTIVLELGHEINFKTKQELIKYLREQQAHISYILTTNVYQIC